jgi:hypothetical protein
MCGLKRLSMQRFWDGCARPLKKSLPYQSLVNEVLASEIAKGDLGLI